MCVDSKCGSRLSLLRSPDDLPWLKSHYRLITSDLKNSVLSTVTWHWITFHGIRRSVLRAEHIPSRNQLRDEFIPNRREVFLLKCWSFYLLKHGTVCVFCCIVGVVWNSRLTANHYQPSTTKYWRYQVPMWGTKLNTNCLFYRKLSFWTWDVKIMSLYDLQYLSLQSAQFRIEEKSMSF